MMAGSLPAAEIASRFGGIRNGLGFLCRCPVPSHGKGRGDRNPSLSLADGANGRLLVKCFAGCDPRDVLAALGFGRENAISTVHPAKSAKPANPDNAARTAKALAIWREAVPAASTLVETYLQARRITITPPASLRCHPALRHPNGQCLPAMVAAVQDASGHIGGIHRTWLRLDGSGKADVSPQKAALGPIGGGAVRLAAAGEMLQLAEGVETALALLEATGNPVWACLGTSGLAAVVLPDCVLRVTICADGDPPGEAAALTLASRLAAEGREARIARPPAGCDFLDVLAGKAAACVEGAAA